jgi:DNA-binding transcriptional ArsR family regulator
MSEATDRLRNLLRDELGECRDADLERRIDALDDLERDTPLAHASADTDVLSTLGDDTRYRLARMLVAAEDDLCVCELEPLVAVSSSAVSHALADLVDAGLATRRKDGKWRYYGATDRAAALLAALDDTREDA